MHPLRVAVMPAFNEAATIVSVLDDLVGRVDRLIVVNDGSSDETGPLVDAWAIGRQQVKVIHFPENRGLSAALRAGWEEGRAMLARGDLSADDVIFSIDADGQHEPAALDGMIEHLVHTGSACVIGRRDMGYHTPYKVFGNKVMTWIGRFSGGHRFEDIESGYRVFRIGPLLEAQEYYRGFRYSETVEVAVLLTRMGYRVDNTYVIQIPVARTRTRLDDAVVDAVCMPLAWYRLACWRGTPRSQRLPIMAWASALVPLIWALAILAMLTHAFYLGDDSAHSYAHVWYLAESLFTRHQWPWHVASLENGDAVMFPYAIIPWLPSALLRPVLGDWVVTLSMALGCVLLVAGLWRFRPAMRNPILFALFLLNPLLWNGVTQFQLATVWSFAFFFFGAWRAERGATASAVIGLALAVAAHPVMGPGAIVTWVLYESVKARTPRVRLAVIGVAGMVLASPAMFLFLSSPSVKRGDLELVALSTVDNIRRLSIVLLPMLLADGRAFVFGHQRSLFAAAAAATLAVLVIVPPSGLWDRSEPRFADYLARHPVVPGEPYRVLTTNNHEDGMVEFLHAGATLSHEFFSESVRRQDFGTPEKYACYLATTRTRHVVLGEGYLRQYNFDEAALIFDLASRGQATEEYDGPNGLAYIVNVPPSLAKENPRACGI